MNLFPSIPFLGSPSSFLGLWPIPGPMSSRKLHMKQTRSPCFSCLETLHLCDPGSTGSSPQGSLTLHMGWNLSAQSKQESEGPKRPFLSLFTPFSTSYHNIYGTPHCGHWQHPIPSIYGLTWQSPLQPRTEKLCIPVYQLSKYTWMQHHLMYTAPASLGSPSQPWALPQGPLYPPASQDISSSIMPGTQVCFFFICYVSHHIGHH